MRRIILVLTVLASLALTASAQARTVHCVDRTVDGVRVTLDAMGRTSCALARDAGRQVARAGYAPAHLTVYSPATRRTYTLRRQAVTTSGEDFYSVTYTGPNGIRLRITARTL